MIEMVIDSNLVFMVNKLIYKYAIYLWKSLLTIYFKTIDVFIVESVISCATIGQYFETYCQNTKHINKLLNSLFCVGDIILTFDNFDSRIENRYVSRNYSVYNFIRNDKYNIFTIRFYLVVFCEVSFVCGRRERRLKPMKIILSNEEVTMVLRFITLYYLSLLVPYNLSTAYNYGRIEQ
ncbi:hypothetical protein AGLY_007972 [Aphis glycines]|uniref:Uncharacterized protein n=1 Tax=Aphis glycines TaxID=307491 RepID=A0A6G0TME2_APHGL|nr:hypothetical protein AGLY_007972 [Aphis glycines]